MYRGDDRWKARMPELLRRIAEAMEKGEAVPDAMTFDINTPCAAVHDRGFFTMEHTGEIEYQLSMVFKSRLRFVVGAPQPYERKGLEVK